MPSKKEKIAGIKSVEYRDAVVKWDDGYIFKLTLLARVHFPPHKSHIVATFPTT